MCYCTRCFRDLFCVYMVGLCLAILLGGASAGYGVYLIMTGRKTTFTAYFTELNDHYRKNSYSDVAVVSGTARASSSDPSTAVQVSGTAEQSGYQINGEDRFWDDSFVISRIGINISNFPSSGSDSITVELSYQPTCDQCSSEAIQTSTIVSSPFPVTNGTPGFTISTVCFVVTRDFSNRPFKLYEDRQSCFYPFDEASNKYRAGVSEVEVIIRSSQDVGHYFLEQHTEGTLAMASDGPITLVDPNTIYFLGGGAAVAGIAFIILTIFSISRCCCCDLPPETNTYRGGKYETMTSSSSPPSAVVHTEQHKQQATTTPASVVAAPVVVARCLTSELEPSELEPVAKETAGPSNEAKNSAGVPVDLPDGDWVLDVESGMYWSDEQQMYFDLDSEEYYDPISEMWYSEKRGEWYTMES